MCSVFRRFDIPKLLPMSVLLSIIPYIVVNLSSLVGHYTMKYVITVTDVNNINNYFVPVALL
jgi:hypothetical protein